MGRFEKLNWIVFCALIFIVSRCVMLYQYDLAKTILFHAHAVGFADMMCKWDCQWYLTIINNGYDTSLRTTPKIWHGLANWAFFPLYPYMVRYVEFVSHIKATFAGILLNQSFVFISLLLFYSYLKMSFDELNSRFGVFLLAFSPFSIYFASLYTEALFLVLSLAGFYYMRQKRYVVAAIFGGLLSATRPLGCMFVVPYVYSLFKRYRFAILQPKFLALIVIAFSGLLLYMCYLYLLTGDALAFHTVQKAWGRHGLTMLHFGSQMRHMLSDSHDSILFVVSCVISVYLWINGYIEEALFNVLATLPGVLTGTMMSEGRFCGTLFTFYFGIVLVARKSNSLKIIIALLFLLFYISYFLYWMAHASFLV